VAAESPGVDLARIGRRLGLFAVVAVAVVVAIATLPGVGEVRHRLSDANPWWIGVSALCSLGSSLGFVVALWGAFDRVPNSRPMLDLGFAEQGANVLLPAGGSSGPAFGTFVMRRAGVPGELAAERHVALFLITSGVSLAALVVAGVGEATGVLPGDESLAWTLLPAAAGAAGIGLALAFAHAEVPAEPVGAGRVRHDFWRLRRFLHTGVRTSVRLLRHGDPLLPIGSVAYYAFDVAALGASFQAFGGGGPPLGLFVLAYTLGHAGALIPTPGGVGGTDGGLIGSFALFGSPLGLATAAVLGYRVFQLGLPIVLGAVSLIRIRSKLADDGFRERVRLRWAEEPAPGSEGSHLH
jgi:uncharacterized membrane protein YbhN (UPF0104 family)